LTWLNSSSTELQKQPAACMVLHHERELAGRV
jgi:hypothetical protein